MSDGRGQGRQDGGDAEIFRAEALARLARHERLDVSLALSPTRRWVARAALTLLAAAALLAVYLVTR